MRLETIVANEFGLSKPNLYLIRSELLPNKSAAIFELISKSFLIIPVFVKITTIDTDMSKVKKKRIDYILKSFII
jgi:hypothetical protein